MARRIRSAAARGAVFFTSSRGICKSPSLTASIVQAGLPQCLDLELSLTNSSPTLLATGYQRAYRAVYCQKDANNNLIQGAPSGRRVVSNTTGGTRDVQAIIRLTPGLTTSNFIQLYATTIVANTVTADDEMRLVLEYFPTSSEISNGYVTLADITPDAFRGADLYTNASQEGIASANDEPPLGRDLVWFQNKLLVANYTDKHEMILQMLGTSGMTTQTITLAGVVYTAATGAGAESVSTGTFQVYKSGGVDLGSQSLNVEGTAMSLCRVINQYAANTSVYAFYESGVDDPPGKIRIVERALGGSQFTVICSASAMGNSFSPAIPTSGSTYASVADRRVNQIRVSKDGQPEHMPRVRNIIVGGEDEEIQRIIALRSSLIVIKDRSIWRITEAEPGDAYPVILDNTCAISGRDSAAVLNNTVFMLSDQGFVAVTDNGIQIVGRPTENRVLAGLEKINAPDHDRFVAIGHEQRRFYICLAYDAAAAENTCYVYSPIANEGRGAWYKRRINANAFAVLSNRLMYALNNANGHVLRQRASRRDGASWYRDYCEDSSTFVVSSIDASAGTITGTWSGGVDYDAYESDIGYGWKLYDGSNQYLVLGSASGNTVLTLNTTTGLAGTPTLTVYRPVQWAVEYAPLAGAPMGAKQFGSVVAKVETQNAYAIDFAYANERDTRSDPASDDWSAQPTADRVYVPQATGAEASSTSNDFGATASTNAFNPFNELRTYVNPQRAVGSHLCVRIAGGVAEGYVAIKGLLVQTEDLETERTRQ